MYQSQQNRYIYIYIYIKYKNGIEYLTLILVDENKGEIKKYKEL